MLKEFKELVDRTDATITAFSNDMIKIADHYQIDTSSGITQSTIIHFISNLIKSRIKPEENTDHITFHQIKKIERALVYDSVLNDTVNREYLFGHIKNPGSSDFV